MKPSDFSHLSPMGSVVGRYEAEIIASNIMTILKRTGDTFRELAWEEYEEERKKDGHFTQTEMQFFDQVIGFCKNEDTARLFCPAWKGATPNP